MTSGVSFTSSRKGDVIVESGNRERGDEVLLPLRMRSHVNVPVNTRRAINMIPVVLSHGANVRRRFLRLEEAQAGIP